MGNSFSGQLSSPNALKGRIERGASQATIAELTASVKKNLAEENSLVTEEDRRFWDAEQLTCFINPQNPKNLIFSAKEKTLKGDAL